MTYMVVVTFIQILGISLVLGSEEIYRTKQYHKLNDLVHDFSNMIQKPSVEFIDLNLDFEDAFDRDASGVYKLIPYYMKIYPKDKHQDRFIIQQNPFNGEFQLIKIFNYIYRKNVRSLFNPNKEIPQKKDLTTINSLRKYQTNVKALAETNLKLIEEIQKTKKQSNNLKEHLQSKEKDLHKDMEQEKRKMKEKKFKLKEEIFQLKLINKENEQKINDSEKSLETMQSTINEQKIMIEKLKIDLSQLTYENVWLKDENSDLTNQLKNAKENLCQVKDKNQKLEKQEKEMQKENENLQKLNENMHDERSSSLSTCEETIKEKLIKPEKQKEKNKKLDKQEKKFQKANEKIKDVKEDHLPNLLHFEEKWKELDMYKHNLETVQLYFQNYYYHFTKTFPDTFVNLSDDCQSRLGVLFKNELLEYKPMFEYEQALIAYGFFKHVEKFRIYGAIHIPEVAIFDPQDLIIEKNTI